MTLPVYYTRKVKGKLETILVGLNKYERMHHQPRNTMKRYYYGLIAKHLVNKAIKGKVKTEYTYFYKNAQSDAPNVVAVIDKLFMDALQENGIIKEDNVKNYIGSSWSVGGMDKENPRIEVRVIEIIEEKENPKQGHFNV
jgi:Holliday junction resolvase RusA-like endonuclease